MKEAFFEKPSGKTDNALDLDVIKCRVEVYRELRKQLKVDLDILLHARTGVSFSDERIFLVADEVLKALEDD